MGGIPSWAVPGQRVECVRDLRAMALINDRGYRDFPAIGKAYTISATYWTPEYQACALFLVGFPRLQGFDVVAFRPIGSEATEQSIFRKKGLHITAPKPERTDA